MYKLIYFCFLLPLCRAQLDGNFVLSDVQTIAWNKDNYFGYSILLQANKTSSRIIVGAPLEYQNVFECKPDKNEKCRSITMLTDNEVKKNYALGTPPLLGFAIDGIKDDMQDFMVCASRNIEQKFYTPGICRRFKDSESISPFDSRSWYGAGYYSKAFSASGLSFQVFPNNAMFIGMPGSDRGNGLVGVLDYETLEEMWSGSTHQSLSDTYLGYSVITTVNKNQRLYIAGEPRGNNMKGQVYIWKNRKFINSLTVQEYGSYFGATLLAEDVDGDNINELFVGAPMMSDSNEFDIGQVYWYKYDKILGTFQNRHAGILKGTNKRYSRFGTTMANLGDIDLDNYKDIAIGAPYEDDGTGVVYIFKGSRLGPILSQTISPKRFNPPSLNTRGFGLGISNGNDIDKNGYNDFIIGAYKTHEVFVIKSKSVIIVNKRIKTIVKSLSEHLPEFNISYCIKYEQRSPIGNLKTLTFNTTLELDYRLKARTNVKVDFIVKQKEEKCETITLETNLKNNINLSPVYIALKEDLKIDDVVNLPGRFNGRITIPISHGCGDDNICEPLLTIEAVSNLKEIVIGKDHSVDIDVVLKNMKEPALKCEVKIEKNTGVKLLYSRECINDNGITCLVGNSFVGEKKFTISFDVREIYGSSKNVSFFFNVTTAAKPIKGSVLVWDLNIPVKIVNSPNLKGISEPESIELKKSEPKMLFAQSYYVGNDGPSPVKLNVHIFTPIIADVISIKSKQISNEEGSLECEIKTGNVDSNSITYLSKNETKLAENKTIFLNCQDTCTEIVCSYEELQASKAAIVRIIYEVNVDKLESKYRSQFLTKDAISFLTTARIGAAVEQIETLIYGYQNKTIPIWLYIVAAVVGLILLLLLIFGLYKCHFFNRTYKEKLMEEKLLDNDTPTRTSEPSVSMSDIETRDY